MSSTTRSSVYNLVTKFFPKAIEVTPDRLYWSATDSAIPRRASSYLEILSTDSTLTYEPFYMDFGPLNLGQTYRYCEMLHEKLTQGNSRQASAQSGQVCVTPSSKATTASGLSSSPSSSGISSSSSLMGSSRGGGGCMAIVHICGKQYGKLANAVYLICAYRVICMDMSPEDAFAPFTHLSLVPFRDATYGLCNYQLPIIECLRGLAYAIKLGWFSMSTFDIKQYEFYERVENGDLNWIIPNKFVAFSGPCSPSAVGERERDLIFLTPEDYIPIFHKLNIKMVIRLNRKQYNRKTFLNVGINHVDLYFLDGSCPPREIVRKFIEVAENQKGPIAVHCKAGLGRTGTLIGCYAIKNYGFPSAAWVAWNRITRPGSILGPQQHFLHEVHAELMGMGPMVFKPAPAPLTPEAATTDESDSNSNTPMSTIDKQRAQQGEAGQGERLLKTKAIRNSGPSTPIRKQQQLKKQSPSITPSTMGDASEGGNSPNSSAGSYSPTAADGRFSNIICEIADFPVASLPTSKSTDLKTKAL